MCNRKIDASLAKKPLTITRAPHLDTKALISKLDEVAKIVALGFAKKSPDVKSPEIQQSKGPLRCCQELDRLLVETERQLLCYNEPSDKLDKENFRICLPLPFSLACFRLEQYKEMGGHMGATKTYANAKQFYYLPGKFDWICALTSHCVICQNNKPKPKHRNEDPLEEWQNDTIPFRTVHIDHK